MDEAEINKVEAIVRPDKLGTVKKALSEAKDQPRKKCTLWRGVSHPKNS